MSNLETSWMIAITVFSIKHFLADFVLQTEYMLGKFNRPPKCFAPLASHCLVHVLFAFILFMIPMALEPNRVSSSWDLIVVLLCYEFATHFLVDLAKAQYTRANKLTSAYKAYWVAIGIDRMMHLVLSIPLIYTLAEMISFCL